LDLDGLALVAFVEFDATRGRRGFAVAEVLQINELFVDAGDLSLQLVELLANRCEVLRVGGLGG